MIMMVADDAENGRPNFAYTVGLTERGLPELLVFALGPSGQTILNDLSGSLLEGKSLPRNTRLHDVFERLDAVLQDVPPSIAEQYLNVAFSKYGDRVQCVQLVWPDAAGRMPWEPGHDESMRKLQPLLAPQ